MSPRVPRVAMVLGVALVAGTCAASLPSDSRRKLGDKYAPAFSDATRNRSVAWDDRTCTFIESAAESTPTAASAVQVRVIPVARTTATVRSRTARAGTVDVTFRCDPPTQPCITRLRKSGAAVIGGDVLHEHTMPVAGSVADMPRVTAELEGLRAACSPPTVDGGQ